MVQIEPKFGNNINKGCKDMKTYSVVIRNLLEDLIVNVYLIKCNDIKEVLLRVCPSLFSNDKKVDYVVNIIENNIKTYSNVEDIKGDEKSLSFIYDTTYSEIDFDSNSINIGGYEYCYESSRSFNFDIKEVSDDVIDKLKNNYNELIKDEDKFKLILLHLYELEYINS